MSDLALNAHPAPRLDPVDAVRATARSAAELHDQERELRFEPGEAGMLRIEVYDGDGELVRTIPPNERLARAMGVTTWRA